MSASRRESIQFFFFSFALFTLTMNEICKSFKGGESDIERAPCIYLNKKKSNGTGFFFFRVQVKGRGFFLIEHLRTDTAAV